MRPLAWELCQQWMSLQDFDGAVRWIVVDDGEEPSQIPNIKDWETVVVRRTPYWEPGSNTQGLNLAAGLKAALEYPLLIIEDDDYYPPNWLSTCVTWLKQADLVGEGMARYYNMERQIYRQLQNTKHASLCATAMNPCVFSYFLKAINTGKMFIDIRLWNNNNLSKKVSLQSTVIGIKGMPGRAGIGSGHSKDFRGSHDLRLETLNSWVGEDAANIYASYINKGIFSNV